MGPENAMSHELNSLATSDYTIISVIPMNILHAHSYFLGKLSLCRVILGEPEHCIIPKSA
jgi:hypothetical protein